MSRLSAQAEKLARDAIHNRKRLQVEAALALVGAERVHLIPEHKLPLFIEALEPTVDELLRSTTSEGLLTTFAALTHRIHASANSGELHYDAAQNEALRTQRDEVKGELLRRLGGAHTIG